MTHRHWWIVGAFLPFALPALRCSHLYLLLVLGNFVPLASETRNQL